MPQRSLPKTKYRELAEAIFRGEKPIGEIAQDFHISRRSVFRLLKKPCFKDVMLEVQEEFRAEFASFAYNWAKHALKTLGELLDIKDEERIVETFYIYDSNGNLIKTVRTSNKKNIETRMRAAEAILDRILKPL